MDKHTGYSFVTIVFVSFILVRFGLCLENVALYKPAHQSGYYYSDYTADKAVDGNKNSAMGAGSCAHPDTTRNVAEEDRNKPAWWRVDLGESYDVYEVVIYNRDQQEHALSNTWVTVSDEEVVTPNNDNICAEIVDGNSRIVTLPCNYGNRNPPLRGRYVTIRKQSGTYLNFCEVYVHSCSRGLWGHNLENAADCSRTCGSCREVEACRVSDGYCLTGCNDGAWDQSCDKECYCAGGQSCERNNGYCYNGCKEGFWGQSCDQYCNCAGGQPCERDDGACSLASTTTTVEIQPDTKQSDSGETSDDMNTGLLAGVVVAVILLIILIIVVIVLIIRYKRSGQPVVQKKPEILVVSGKPMASDYAYVNPALENGDIPHTIKVDPKDEIVSSIPNGTNTPVSRSGTPELLTGEDEMDPDIYSNPMTIAPIKVPELSTYIEKKKSEVDGFKKEYQQLPSGDKAKWEVGNKAENRNKNRFVNIRAYDHSRVVLKIEDGDIHSDYINADFITGYKDKPKVYVAAQGPKKSTITDTWRMLWELNANRMVMVTNLVEGGKPKCEQYWPDTEEQYGKFKVVLTSSEKYADYSIKQFTVTHQGETRTVHHLHFTSWPDHGVPITATALLNFRRKVRSYDNVATGPMVVHCSAGVGRTGTFIALDYLLQQAKVEGEVDIYGYACIMRSNRVNMIQTLEQYIFVYDGLLEALMSGDTSIPCPDLKEKYEELQQVDPKTNKSKLQDQFDVLQVLKPAKREEKFTALEPQNRDKNRDLEIVPSNRFRPFLSIKVDGCTDYINAVYIDGYKMRLAYILTQSPLPNTISDIWRLAYDHASRTIVMLNQLDEEDEDCPVYWPKDKESPLEFPPLKVSLVEETVDGVTPSITVRDFSIVHSSKPNNPVTVKQFHLTNWAEDEELPESKKDLLDVMDLVERWQQQSSNGPVTIHCRNGSAKSGLYCAATYMVEKLKLDQEVDVFHAVKHVRVCRSSNVPSMEQYKYLHELALEYMDKYEIYANFK